MHNAALAAVGLDPWRYQHLPVPPELFAETVRALPALGFVGVNVTIPHKVEALALADEATPSARAIGAANTLTFAPDGAIAADNTDALGLLAALGAERPRTAVILGAGGSGRAAAYALAQAGVAVKVWNRTLDTARSLAADLGVEAVQELPPADLLVHCTSVGLADPSSTFEELPLGADALGGYACVVDLVYHRAGGTELLREAQRRGSRVIDGLEILVHQGALSFERWTGRPAPVEVMRDAARGSASHVDDLARPPAPASGPATQRGGDERAGGG